MSNSSDKKPPDIEDYIGTIEDRVPNYHTSATNDDNKPKVWARPLGYSAGLRRPSALRGIMARQNIDARIFQTQRIRSHEDAMREASMMRTASTIPTVQILNGEEAVALRDPYGHLEKLRFENAYRADPVARRCIDILAKFVMGKRTHFHISSGNEEGEDSMLIAHGFAKPPASSGHLPPDLKPPSPGGGFGGGNQQPSAADIVGPEAPPGPRGMMPSGTTDSGPKTPPPTPTTGGGGEDIEEMFGVGGGGGDGDEQQESPLSEQELRELFRMISDVNRRVKFHERVKAALTQAYVYGRAALLVETDQQGVPTELKLLNSKKLETVYVDPQSWKMMAVDYSDRPKEEPLLAEEIIYFANQDFHISPDTLFYGLSRLETVVHVSETNQLLDEIDLKEGARSMWAGSGVIKFPPDTPDELVEEFVGGFYPGTWNATSQNVQIDTYTLRLDYISLAHVREQNDKRIIRALGVPSFLVGFENISNRATSEEVMISWHESELDAERTWLQDVLEPQYFDYLIGIRFPDLLKTKNDPTRILTGEAQPVRVKLDFQNISFETIREKSEAIVPLYDRGLCTPEKALELLRWQDQTDAVLAELERREMVKQRQQEMDFALRQQRAQSYLLARTQENVEEKRREKKEEGQQQLTAQAALQNLQAMQSLQANNSITNELELLRIKLLKEAHQKDMSLKEEEMQFQAQRKRLMQEMEEAYKKMQEASN
jgi:hypothetical protein